MASRDSVDIFYKLTVGLLALFGVIWLSIKVATYFEAIVMLLGLSFLMSYILIGPVNLLEPVFSKITHSTIRLSKLTVLERMLPRKLPRAFAILFVYIWFAFLMLIISVRIVPLAFEQLQEFNNELPGYIEQGEHWLSENPTLQSYLPDGWKWLGSQSEESVTPEEFKDPRTSEPKNTEPEKKPKRRMVSADVIGADLPVGTPVMVTNGPVNLFENTYQLQFHSHGYDAQDVLVPIKYQTDGTTGTEIIRERFKLLSPEDINKFVREHIRGTLSNFFRVISSTLTGLVYTLASLVLIFYFLLDGRTLKAGFVKMMPEGWQGSVEYLLCNLHLVMFGFIKGQLLLAMVTGIYMIVIYSIMDVPYAIFLGGFFAVAEILPVVGTWIGFLPGIVVLLFVSPIKLVIMMGLVYAYQTVKDNIVLPKIMGDVMGLHPVIVIVSLLLCAKAAGLVGVLFAIPFASMVNVFIRYFQHPNAAAQSVTD